MKLVIAEKPSVAKDLAKVLKANQRKDGFYAGDDFLVTWAFGHLVTLSNPEVYGENYKKWQMQDLPIIPAEFRKEIVNNDGARKQFNTIAELLNNNQVDSIICATDAGREGELIFRLIYEQAKCEKPIERLWISSQTDKAILEGFAKLKPGTEYIPLYNSALSRSEADWLIGMNATRCYTIKYSRGKGVMSVGRVQTPVLKMIVDRHLEFVNFKPETYYEIWANFEHENGKYQAKWFKDKEDRLQDKNKATEITENLSKLANGKIAKVEQKEVREKQPLLYDLTQLQKDANIQFKFSADQTLTLMQSLYEKHKILTYPRTSSNYLSTDMMPKLQGLIENIKDLPDYKHIVAKLLESPLKITKRIIDDSKVTDHHAIILTEKKPILSELSPEELKIFELVVKRFIAVFLDECVKSQTEIITDLGGETFRTLGITILNQGWREIYKDAEKAKSKKKADTEEPVLPNVLNNDTVAKKKVELEEKQTKAPALFSEASILAQMETAGKNIDDEEVRQAMKECGLGTPATRAQIIERLIQVGYIIREKNKLIPTEKGYMLINCIQDPQLVSPELTGLWEKKLNDLAQKKYTREKFMTEIKEFTEQIVENVAGDQASSPNFARVSLGSCPLCKEGTIWENQKAFGCSNWKEKECKFTIWKTIAGKAITPEIAKTLMEKGYTEKLGGFMSRAGKPFETVLVLKEGKVEFQF